MRQLVVSLEKHDHLESDPVEKDTFVRTNMALMLIPINYMTWNNRYKSIHGWKYHVLCKLRDSRMSSPKRRRVVLQGSGLI